MTETEILNLLQEIPIVDNHCHPPHRRDIQTKEELKRYFTESFDPRIVAGHVQHTLFYQQSLRDMASILECRPEPQAIVASRLELGLPRDFQRVVQRANIRDLVMDFGYQPEESYSLAEVNSSFAGQDCTVRYTLRLETRVEQLMLEHRAFDRFIEAYRSEVRDLKRKGVTPLKSVIAYRSGLDIRRANEEQAAVAFDLVQAQVERDDGRIRVQSKPLLDFLVPLAMEAAAEQGVPFQFHTALGDTDVDLLEANPLKLRPILEDAAFRELPIVLLHCYPYLREAAYLSSMYGNVYFDLSMTIPLLSFTSSRALEDALGVAPASKLLYGSDAPGIVDYLWLGAVAWRRALAQVLAGWTGRGMPKTEAMRIATLVLFENGRKLYG